MRRMIVLAACGMMISGGSAAATEEKIGSWVLSCPAPAGPDGGREAEPCLLRFEKRLLDTAGVIGDVEVLALGKSLVPVLALRGLSAEVLMAAAAAGTTEASMRFGGGQRVALDCAMGGAEYTCSPRDDAARTLGAGLPTAKSLTLRVSFVVAGLKPLVQEKTLELSRTNEALDRLRMAGATRAPAATPASALPSPGRLMEMADKALKAAGYANGVADLQALVAKYRGK